MKKIVVGLLIITIVILGLGYFITLGVGAKNLGISISPKDSEDATKKVGIEIIAIKPGENKSDYSLEGKRAINLTMDSKELTAHSNNRKWKNYPVKNVQIKIHDDGTIEGSGILIVSKAMPYAMSLGYSREQITEAMKKYKIPSVEVPVYVKGKGSVANNKVDISASSVKIGLVSIPGDIVARANMEAEKLVEDIIQKHSQSFEAKSLTFENGLMNFVGAMPEKEYVLTE